MLVYKYPRILISFIFSFIFLLSCDDANYQLDNEFDPENLNLSPPTIFFHPSQFESIEVGSSDTLELYCYEVQNVAGAHLQIEFDAEIVSIDTVFYGDFFMNGVNSPIMFTDPERVFSCGTVMVIDGKKWRIRAIHTGVGRTLRGKRVAAEVRRMYLHLI